MPSYLPAILAILVLWPFLGDGVEDIYIAGLLPMSGEQNAGIGKGVLPAINLALQHVNDDGRVLPNHRLELVWNDTEVSYKHSEKQRKKKASYECLYDIAYFEVIMYFENYYFKLLFIILCKHLESLNLQLT